MSLRTPAIKKILLILGLFVLTLLYFHDVLTGKVLLVERDLATFFYPYRFIWVETVRQGHFPFWNPYIKCGVPLFASIQPGVLYPFSLLYLFLPLDLAFNWTIIFHFFLAGVFTYCLMRELGASLQGALAAALAFVFSGYLISVHNVLNTLLSVSWYPLVMLCGCRMIRTGLFRWIIASGVSLCCMFLGGGIEIVLLTLASLLFLCLYPKILPLDEPEKFPNLQRRLVYLGLVFLIFFGLSMVQILPFLELYKQSHRYGGVTLKEATLWSLAPKDLIYFLLPSLYGPTANPDQYWKLQNYLKTIYVGPVVLCLGGIYFFRQGKRGLALLAAMALTLLFALGSYTPLYPFFYKYFPLFSTLRYPVKFLFLFVFYLCVAAGLGLDVLRNRFSKMRHPPYWCQGLLVAAVLIMATIYWFARFHPEQIFVLTQKWDLNFLNSSFFPLVLHNFNRMLVVTVLLLFVFFFGLRHKLVRLGSPLLLMLLALDLFLGNRGYALKLDAASFHAENNIIRTLKADPDLFRFYVLPEVKELQLPPKSYAEDYQMRKEILDVDLMMEYHLFDIYGYNIPVQRRYENLRSLVFSKPLTSIRPLLDLLNVKYVLTDKPVELEGLSWLLDGPATSRLYENKYYLPRAFLVEQFQVIKTDQEFANAFRELTFDPRTTILLEEEPTRFLELKKAPIIPKLKSTVSVITYENNRIALGVTTPAAALLFMSEAYYPGWKAYVDGRPEEILRANYTFRAIPLGPGTHRVEMVMEPLSFKIGLTVTVVTMALLFAGWVFEIIRKRRAWSISLRSQNSESSIQEKTNQD
ncbi:MAG: YfhO family protein [Deltaproteobacteria bacterium]|nr:YfhO family protein [Deltaproteobacteria bacterium]